MTVKTPAQLAHERLLQQLRERTRTHKCDSTSHPRGVRYAKRAKLGLKERLLKLQAAGMTRKQMAFECGTSSKTIVRLLGKVRFW
jgi:hypothetical protein